MQYLIWDFDGTLGYREGGMWTATLLEIMQEHFPELGVTYDKLKVYLRSCYPWHFPEQPHPELSDADEWWRAFQPVVVRAMIGVGAPSDRAEELSAEFRPRYTELSRWRLFPDTLPVLEQLAERGWTHMLLTNHVPELPSIVGHLGLTPHLGAIFNSAQTGYEKPHPQAFHNAQAWMTEPEVVWMIGDNYKADVQGAEAQGIPAILARTTHPDARYRCEDLAGVVEIVEKEYLAGSRK